MESFTLKWNQEMAEQNHKFYDDHIISSRCPAKYVSGGSGSGGRRTTGEQLVSDHNNDESE